MGVINSPSAIIQGGSNGLGLFVPTVTAGFVKTDVSGNISISASGGTSAYNPTSKTANYNANANDFVTASGASFTVTLPTAVGVSGQIVGVYHNGTSLTQVYTINTTASQTITYNGSAQASGAIALYTNSEIFIFMSNGSNWEVITHQSQTSENNAGATTITGSTSNPSKGTATRDTWIWWRAGKYMNFRYELDQSAGAAAGSGDYILTLPTSGSMDTTNLTTNNTVIGTAYPTTGSIIGTGWMNQSTGATRVPLYMYVSSSTTFRVILQGAGVWNSANNPLTDAMNLTILGQIPMTGWQP